MREQTYAVTHRGYCRGYSRGYSRGYNGAIVGLFDLPNPCQEKKNLPALNLAPLYSHFDLLSRPPTAGLNTQGLCNPGRITVEGKNLAPLYSHVDFPSPPPGPPALILLRGWETITTLVFVFFLGGPCATTHSNIKAGGEGAVLGKSTCE